MALSAVAAAMVPAIIVGSGGAATRRSDPPVPAWRFFSGPGGWKWQQISGDRQIVAESSAIYETYDECIRAAASRGYAFTPSQDRLKGSPILYNPQRLHAAPAGPSVRPRRGGATSRS